jgi:peptidoglycan/xylan/chitin deacetylase (PgdA/CDA1 family)
MRMAIAACALAIVVFLAIFGVVLAQKGTPGLARAPVAVPAEPKAKAVPTAVVTEVPTARVAAAPAVTAAATAPAPATPSTTVPAAPAAAPAPPAASACTGNPNALGLARVVEIDTTGGPGFGFEHFKSHDFLRTGEVVLTFDDGPWPRNTPAVLAALASHCTKATFFPIGKHATYHPEILKQVAAAGHTIGSHTWSHVDLSGKKMTDQLAKDEIEKGFSAVRWALGAPAAPFFRFPALKHPPAMVTYLGERGIGIFSTDMDSFDFKTKRPDQVVNNVMNKLKKFGKGIVLMHDFQSATADAAPALLQQLKLNGYKIVALTPREAVKTIASYDEAVVKDQKLPTVSDRPTSSVVRTISE